MNMCIVIYLYIYVNTHIFICVYMQIFLVQISMYLLEKLISFLVEICFLKKFNSRVSIFCWGRTYIRMLLCVCLCKCKYPVSYIFMLILMEINEFFTFFRKLSINMFNVFLYFLLVIMSLFHS